MLVCLLSNGRRIANVMASSSKGESSGTTKEREEWGLGPIAHSVKLLETVGITRKDCFWRRFKKVGGFRWFEFQFWQSWFILTTLAKFEGYRVISAQNSWLLQRGNRCDGENGLEVGKAAVQRSLLRSSPQMQVCQERRAEWRWISWTHHRRSAATSLSVSSELAAGDTGRGMCGQDHSLQMIQFGPIILMRWLTSCSSYLHLLLEKARVLRMDFLSIIATIDIMSILLFTRERRWPMFNG